MHHPSSSPDPDRDRLASAREVLLGTAAAVASSTGDDIFRTLVRGVAEILGVDLVFVGVYEPEAPRRVRAIAVWDRGEPQDDFEYLLEGTPCDGVVGQQFRFYPQGVQGLFPDPHLKEVGAVGYAAIPLFTGRGSPLGLMAVVDRKPLRDRELTAAVLGLFAVRAAVEVEQRETARALRLSEESYRSIFDAAEDPLFIHDADTGAILDVNPKACEVYGYSAEELRRVDIGELSSGIPPYTGERAAELVARARREGPVFVEWQRRNKDGSLHWDEVYIKLVRIGGTDRILAVTREVTERRRAEEERVRLEGQLRQAQKMEAIGQLTGGIAHDFNNILTALSGYVSMAQERVRELGDARLARYLERAQASGQRARDLIQQLLTFSRGRRGEPRSLSLGPVLEQAVELLRSSLPSSVEIRTQLARDVPCVLVDPLHVEQVLMNLCINASDAMEGKGMVVVRLGTAHGDGCDCSACHQPVTGDFVELSVADTGPGIPRTVQERMFEPFYTTKPVGRGSGMGLAVVHGIVHEYGGHVQVESLAGVGTEVCVWLPAWFPPLPAAASETNEPAPPQADDLSPALAGRVLLCEDEPAVREFMEDLLRSWGLAVVTAENGIDGCALFAADADAYSLVILDQTMPRMSGLEAAQQISKMRPSVPVILYTGYSEKVSSGQLFAAGVRALVRKPLDIPALRATLSEMLGETPTPPTAP